MSFQPGSLALCSLARRDPQPLSEPRVQGGLSEAALVAAVCEEGRSGGWGAGALLRGPRHLPVLAVVEHLAPGPQVGPPAPLGGEECCGHVHIPARSFTAAETGRRHQSEKKKDRNRGEV